MARPSDGTMMHGATPRHGKPLKQTLKELFSAISDDNIFGRAAQLAYYFFFSIFPGFIFISTLLGMIAGGSSGFRTRLLSELSTVVPPSAMDLLRQAFGTAGAHTGKLTFGVVTALWSATVGMVAACDTLNAVHDVKESRPWWKVRLVALGLTIVTTALLLCAFGALVAGDFMIHSAGQTSLSGAVWIAIKIGQWAVALALVALVFGITYFWAPDVKEREWHWITPGAALGILLWGAASVALRIYLHYFNSYSVTFGTVGAVMILLLWFYIAGSALLIGAEVNAVMEDKAAREGDPEATERGREGRPRLPECGGEAGARDCAVTLAGLWQYDSRSLPPAIRGRVVATRCGGPERCDSVASKGCIFGRSTSGSALPG